MKISKQVAKLAIRHKITVRRISEGYYQIIENMEVMKTSLFPTAKSGVIMLKKWINYKNF